MPPIKFLCDILKNNDTTKTKIYVVFRVQAHIKKMEFQKGSLIGDAGIIL